MFDFSNIDTLDNSDDGILGVKLKTKLNDFQFVVLLCYLSENSLWDWDSSFFFTLLLTQIYMHSESIIIWGEFNSRLGSTQDCNDCTDELPPAIITDNTQNHHANSHLVSLNNSSCCVLTAITGMDRMSTPFILLEENQLLTIFVYLKTFWNSLKKFVSPVANIL